MTALKDNEYKGDTVYTHPHKLDHHMGVTHCSTHLQTYFHKGEITLSSPENPILDIICLNTWRTTPDCRGDLRFKRCRLVTSIHVFMSG
jgi:hypothetical protein